MPGFDHSPRECRCRSNRSEQFNLCFPTSILGFMVQLRWTTGVARWYRVDAGCVLPSSRSQVMRRRRHYTESSSGLVVLPHSLLSLQVTPGCPEEDWGILGVTPPVSMVRASISENPCRSVLDTWYSSRNCNQTLLQTFIPKFQNGVTKELD